MTDTNLPLDEAAREAALSANRLHDALDAWNAADHEGENPSDDGARWDELAANVEAHRKIFHPLYNLCCRWTRDHGAAVHAEVLSLRARVAKLEAELAERTKQRDESLAAAIRALAAQEVKP